MSYRQSKYVRVKLNSAGCPAAFWYDERKRGDVWSPLMTVDFMNQHLGGVSWKHRRVYVPENRSIWRKIVGLFSCRVLRQHLWARHEQSMDGEHCAHCGHSFPPAAW